MSPSDPLAVSALADLQRYERSALDGTLPALILGLHAAAAALPADSAHRETFTLLGRAIRRDLAFLIEHPEEIFARLYALCRFHDSAEAMVRRATEPGALVSPFQPKASALGDLLERWATERTRSGRPWLRFLQPSDALTGPLIEVYRGAGRRPPVRMRIDDDGRRIYLTVCQRRLEASASDPEVRIEWRTVGWDRSTGKSFEGESFIERVAERGIFVSPDGRVRVEANDWGKCRLVDAVNGAEIVTLPVPGGRVWGVHFFADRSRVALVGHDEEDDGLVMIFDLGTRSLVKRVTGGRTIFHVTGTRDDHCLATCDSERVVIWEWQSGRVLASIPTAASHVAFSSDGRTLFTEKDDEVRVWDLESAAHTPDVHVAREPWVTNAAFSPDGTALLLGAWLCDARTGVPRAKLAYWFGHYLEGGPSMDAFRMTDERIALLGENVDVWSTREGRRLIDGHERFPNIRHVYWDLIAIDAEARAFAKTRRRDRKRDEIGHEEVVIRAIDTGGELARFAIHGASCLSFSPDGSRLAAGSCDGVVRVWDARTGTLLTSFSGHRHSVSGVAFLAGGELAVSGAEDDAVCVWDTRSGVERLRRDLGAEAPHYTVWSATDGGGTRRYWQATPAAIAEAEIWAGLRRRRHPWRAKRGAGTLHIVHVDTGHVVGTLPTSADVVPHPDSPIWAGGGLHFVLEDGTDGRA